RERPCRRRGRPTPRLGRRLPRQPGKRQRRARCGAACVASLLVGPRRGADRPAPSTGPPGDTVLEVVDEEFWRDDVEDLADKVGGGHEPAPVVASFRGDHLRLEDGNRRVEALRRAGNDQAWTV